MAIKSFEECLSEAAIERGLNPEVVLEVVARARKLESESQKEAAKETLAKTGQAAKKLGLGIFGAAKGAVKGAAEEAKKVDLKRVGKKAEEERAKEEFEEIERELPEPAEEEPPEKA